DIVRQWTNVHGLPENSSHHEFAESFTRRVWSDPNGEALIEAFSISGMAHGVPLATTTDESCGSAGAFFLDVGASSTHHIARFWCLHKHESMIDLPDDATPVSATIQIANDGGALVMAGAAAEGARGSAEASLADDEERQSRHPLDPNAIIAAAFKAAGLPVPEIPAALPGPSPRVAPGPIIAAALKAAGLVRS
ncbi:hypothetical protein JQ553_34185, partial [Bradyrhizobium lablabi]|nr:hypothetical protein [Bradyrhizobium lablabi]